MTRWMLGAMVLGIVFECSISAEVWSQPSFTYQGQLSESNAPANGLYEMDVRLFDSESNGSPVALQCTQVPVNNGLFTLNVAFTNFPPSLFNGSSRWLEVAVRLYDGTNEFTKLTPRQPITPAPYASFAYEAATANSVAWSNVTLVPPEVGITYRAGQGLAEIPPNGPAFLVEFLIATGGVNSAMLAAGAVSAEKIADASLPPSKLATSNAVAGQVIGFDGTNAGWLEPVILPAWLRGGNGGTDPQNDFLGTKDNSAFELRVNNVPGLRLEPTTSGAVNVIGGNGNSVDGPAVGSVVGGGQHNWIQGDSPYSVISGGKNSSIQCDLYAAIGGGLANWIGTNSHGSFIGGGASNRIEMNSPYSVIGGGGENQFVCNGYGVIGGGLRNSIAMLSHYPTIGGGRDNQIGPNTEGAVIPGGIMNVASGPTTFAAGREAGALHQATFVWNDNSAGPFSSTASNQFLIHAAGGIGINVPDPSPNGVSISSTGTALELRSGAIRVTGAGLSTPGPAFIHKAVKGITAFDNYTIIDHPLCNDDSNAILIVTQNWNPGGIGGTYNNSAIGVFYNFGSRWAIFNQNQAEMPDGASFNVLVIKP
jgi:hypothetical protein